MCVCFFFKGIFTVLVISTDVKSALSPLVSENVIFTYLLGFGITNSIVNPVIYAARVDIVRKHVNRCWFVNIIKSLRGTNNTENVRSFATQETNDCQNVCQDRNSQM